MLQGKIDYQDPILNQRIIFLAINLNHEQARVLISKIVYLERKDPEKPIDLYIASDRGSAVDMVANFMKTLKSPLNTYVLDTCASVVAIVLAAGTGKRSAFATSRISVHIVISETTDEDHLDFPTARLDQHANVQFWRTHSTLPEEYYSTEEDTMYNLTPEEALKYGIVDEIIADRRRPSLKK